MAKSFHKVNHKWMCKALKSFKKEAKRLFSYQQMKSFWKFNKFFMLHFNLFRFAGGVNNKKIFYSNTQLYNRINIILMHLFSSIFSQSAVMSPEDKLKNDEINKRNFEKEFLEFLDLKNKYKELYGYHIFYEQIGLSFASLDSRMANTEQHQDLYNYGYLLTMLFTVNALELLVIKELIPDITILKLELINRIFKVISKLEPKEFNFYVRFNNFCLNKIRKSFPKQY